MKKRYIFLGIVLLLLLIFLHSNSGYIKTTGYTITSAKIPAGFDGVRILQLTDLHSHEYGQNNKDLIAKIRKIDPDYIFCTGDMMNSWDDDGSVFLSLVEQISGEYPVYIIYGNHEQMSKSIDSYAEKLTQAGGIVLNDAGVTLERDGGKIKLYGLIIPIYEYVPADYEKPKNHSDYTYRRIETAIGPARQDMFNLLLAHTPTKIAAYSAWGADLVLCGHMHGGIVQVPFMGGLLSPEKEFFPDYCSGYFEYNQTRMIIGTGLGYGVIPVRLFNPPELVVITLSNSN